MKITTLARFGLCAAALGICACGGTDAPKTPLGAKGPRAAADESVIPGIAGEAKQALDSGNALFRKNDYNGALVQYQRSAQLAPTEAAPLLGIMMVADVTKDSNLSAATLPRIRKLNPSLADSSSRTSHSKMIEAHRRAGVRTPPP